jgi:hydrogenase-4 component B
VAKVMPLTATAYFVGVLSVTGIPPFACFWSKFMIVAGALQVPGGLGIGIMVTVLVESLVAFGWMLHVGQKVFLGEQTELARVNSDPPFAMSAALRAADDRLPGRTAVRASRAGPPRSEALTHESHATAEWHMTTVLLQLAVGALLVGALASLATARSRRLCGWVSLGFVAASLLLWLVVLRAFSGQPDAPRTLLRLPAVGAALVVQVDALSAVFLAIIATIAVLTTLFAVHYLDRFTHDSPAKYYPVLQVLCAGIIGVVVTAVLFFLVFWELMTLASFFLVVFEREDGAAQRAGLKYFVVNQAAALGMLAVAVVLWRSAGSFHFDALRVALGSLLITSPLTAHLLLALLFLGFATKAGVLPMGSWLPAAYPAAPTSATALFGGIMSKLGIYGLLRVFVQLLPLSSATTIWGGVIALAGLGSLFTGTLMALQQDDTKRLMSFHVIGQVGYMFLAIGTGLLLLRSSPGLGALALLAGMFHMLNNSLYKSCLFLTAGALEYRTGTTSLAALRGGLGAVMTGTAACALLAALAIAGVPPLNGFASKWLIYATGILGSRDVSLLAIAVVVAMFISLVTLASFVKYLGGAFLGAPDSTRSAREVPWPMLAPQVVLAALCVAFGLFPMFPLQYLYRGLIALPSAAGLPALSELLGGGPGLALADAGVVTAAWAPLPLAFGLALLAALCYWLLQRGGEAEVRDVPVWVCGEEEEWGRAVPPAALAVWLKLSTASIRRHGHLPAFPQPLRRALDPDRWLYYPIARASESAAQGVSRTHVGVLQVYLLWIILGAAAVLALILLLGGGGT